MASTLKILVNILNLTFGEKNWRLGVLGFIQIPENRMRSETCRFQ